MMEDFANSIAKLCIEKYNFLKKGKPNAQEWTVLSGIILKNSDGLLSLVALATGTKCLGKSELINGTRQERGSRLSDSHAEILARRAFIRYLYDQIDLAFSGFESIVFSWNGKDTIKMNSTISFHFFSSQTPCGDCSIFPIREMHNDRLLPHKIRRIGDNFNGCIITNPCYKDIHRTGAKCVKGEEAQDPYLPGVNYHAVGPLRTKPGRGDPTISLSCSDKIAKWLILGLQGSLLSLLISPIKLESITIGGDCPFSLDAMERGLHKRFNNEVNRPKIFQAKTAFIHKKGQQRSHPCPTSIIWCAVRSKHSALQMAVAGRKQGETKKKKGNSLLISRQMLLQTFLQILDKYQSYYNEIKHPKKITYYDWKQWSIYQNKWKQLKLESFCNWPHKPVNLQNFIL